MLKCDAFTWPPLASGSYNQLIGVEWVFLGFKGERHRTQLAHLDPLRGIVDTITLMARVKLRADYHREHVWASTDEVQQAVEAREPTDAERVALAKKAEALAAKKKAKR